MNVTSTHLVSSHTVKGLDCFWIKYSVGSEAHERGQHPQLVSSHTDERASAGSVPFSIPDGVCMPPLVEVLKDRSNSVRIDLILRFDWVLF